MKRLVIAALALSCTASVVAAQEYGFNDFLVDAASEVLRPPQSFDEMAQPAEPDYALPDSWAAYPGRVDGSDDTTIGHGANEESMRAADVFFVHPATYISDGGWNGPAHDKSLPMKAVDNVVMQNFASAFNACCRVFAPRYRQATMYAMATPLPDSRRAIELAYSDVARAFRHYIEHENNGRPFILASHSQGGWHLMRLLAKEVEGTPLEAQFVAAYLPGYLTPADEFERNLKSIHLCANSEDTKCVNVWNSFGPDGTARMQRERIEHYYGDHYELVGDKPVVCVNPVTWTSAREASAWDDYLGTANFGPVTGLGVAYMGGSISARCDEGLLRVERSGLAHLVGAVGFPEDDTHPYDFTLFYMNIRANAVTRTEAWVKARGVQARM